MLKNSIKKHIDEVFVDFNNTDTPGCILSIIKDGQVLYKNTYGMANLELDVPITENTVFHVGSIAKQFTAMCIALLEEEGKIYLEDSVKKFIPELPEYCLKITVKNLVYMTNGIRDFYHVAQYMMGTAEDNFINEEEAFKILCGIKNPIFNPGEDWMYGNSGYFLLSLIVKRITGKSLALYAEENIFSKLGMKNTFIRQDTTKIIKNRAQGYAKNEYLHYNGVEPNNNNDKFCINHGNCTISGAGQVWTTIGDLYIWDQNFYNNKLGKANKELITKVTTSGKLNNGKECGYGYGLFLGERNGKRHVYHRGGAAGFQSVHYRLPDEKLSIICFTNTNYGLVHLKNKLGLWLSEYIVDLILEDKPLIKNVNPIKKVAKTAFQINNDELIKLTGSYQCPETSSIWEISSVNDKLVVNENREEKFELVPVDKNVFEAEVSDMKCIFKKQIDNTFEIDVISKEKEYKFIPFLQKQLEIDELSEYVGQYYCDQIDTTFIITIDNEKLYMKNKERQLNCIDFHYSSTIKDNFINYNDYTGSMSITFNRDNNDSIKSFIFRDYDGDKREYLEFARLK